MSYTQADLDSVNDAIKSVIVGSKAIQVNIGGKMIRYADPPSLSSLYKLRDDIRHDLGMSVAARRTYASNAGRG